MDFMSLLGAMMQGGATPSAGSRMQNAISMGGIGDMLSSLMGAGSSGAGAGGGGLGDMLSSLMGAGSSGSGASGGGLGDLLSSLMGAGSSGGSASSGSGAGGLGDMLSSLTGGLFGSDSGSSAQTPTPTKQASSSRSSGGMFSTGQSMFDRAGKAVGGKDNLAAALGGALLGSLTSKNNSAMKGIGGGLMGLLGMMAYKALTSQGSQSEQVTQSRQAAQSAQAGQVRQTRQTAQPAFNPSPVTPEQQNEDAKLLIMAMCDAAKADGQIDQNEFSRITEKVKEAGIGQEGMNYILQLLKSPMNTNAIVAAVRNRPEMAVQVYIASLMAIEVDTKAERNYLDKLAKAMGLTQPVVRNIEQLMGVPQTC